MDLTNRKIDKLTIVKSLGNNRWKCMCECGNEYIALTHNLLNNKTLKQCDKCYHKSRVKDMTGKICGNWKVIEYDTKGKWKCQCLNCGRTELVIGYNLRSGHTKSCGCNRLIDLKGREIGEWKVEEYVGNSRWKCKCSCGTEKVIHSYELRNGETKSCGCKKWQFERETMLDRYNELTVIKSDSKRTKEQISAVYSKDNLEEFIKSQFNYKPTTYELSRALGINIANTLKKLHKFKCEELVDIDSRHSKIETEIVEYLRGITDTEIILGDREELDSKEIDIYLPEKKFAIEVNGILWHSNIYKDSKYHQDKVINAGKKGIHLIHIFEHEWCLDEQRDKIKNLLYNTLTQEQETVTSSSDSLIENISDTEYNKFRTLYRTDDVRGIKDTEKLAIRIKDACDGDMYRTVAILSILKIDKPNKVIIPDITWKDNIVNCEILKNVYRRYNVDTIEIHIDLSKYSLEPYIKNRNFTKATILSPRYQWINKYTFDYMSDEQAKLMINSSNIKNKNEDEIMTSLNYLKVYDAGSISLEYDVRENETKV
jgi:hypothetical protein